MSGAYYNEFDSFAAAWLRELIKDGQIAPGDVDERSITEVTPDDVRKYTQCHFFAGIGGWSRALRLASWADDRPVWTGSCPCQPFSAAGSQDGADDPRHLWPAWSRLIRECRPHIIFGEQVEAAVAHGWLDLVCDDLEREGYAVGAAALPACSVGAPHIRQRVWFAANARRNGTTRRESDIICGPGSSDGTRERYPAGQPSVFDELGHPDIQGSQGQCRDPERAGERPVSTPSVADVVADARCIDGERWPREQRPGDPCARRSVAAGDVGGVLASSIPTGPTADGELAHPDGGEPGDGGLQRGWGHDERPDPSFWSTGIWIPCRDGKSRIIEPGVAPLVAGVPHRMVPSGDPSEAYAQESREARIGRLRGYGNAIVPQVAARFIQAYTASEADRETEEADGE